jgi:hypothetical protein
MTSTGGPAASWYPDPTGRHEHRYWDGERWTVHVADNGVTGVDGPTQQPAAQQPAAQQQAVVHEQPTSTAGWAPVPERPAPTPQYAWQPSQPSPSQPSSTTAEWQGSAGAASAGGPSSRGRGWIFAIAILVAVAGIGATAMVALGRNDDTTSATSGERYPAIVETNFMTGCTRSGGNETFCRCALDRLEEDYDLDEFAEAEQSYVSSGKLPDSMMSAVRDCVSHLYQQ